MKGNDCLGFVRSVVRFPSDLYDQLRVYADARYMSINSTILYILSDFFKRQNQVKQE